MFFFHFFQEIKSNAIVGNAILINLAFLQLLNRNIKKNLCDFCKKQLQILFIVNS